jgi:hypothetical protein
MNAWAAHYTGMADSYVPELVSRQVFKAWAGRYTGLANTVASQDQGLNAYAARYTRQAGSLIVAEPASQQAFAAWSARYAGMVYAFNGEK